MGNAVYDIPCSFFDFKQQCPLDAAKPVVLKSGKCLFHTTGDHSHDNDWMDCYTGCIKHDPHARMLYLERQRTAAPDKRETVKRARLTVDMTTPEAKRTVSATPTPLNLSRLERIALTSEEQAADLRIRQLITDAVRSRITQGLTWRQVSAALGQAPDYAAEYFRPRPTKMMSLSYTRVIKVVNFIRDFDKQQRQDQKP